jgi:3-dehydroquinate synthase
VVVVTHPELKETAASVAEGFAEAGVQSHVVDVEAGEPTKSLAAAARLYEELAEAGIHRHDLVVGVGGGVITDLTGFVAGTYLRGVGVVHVPSTLLGQVDAAIGGKAGVNLPQGKNLVGVFHQPLAVICDVSLLDGLPDAELRAGLAEVIKYGFISDPELLSLIESGAAKIFDRDRPTLIDIVVRCAAAKASVVSADERDMGTRMRLNYGHTFAHAIENAAGYRGIRHGEAVALGMVAAACLAQELGMIDADLVERHIDVLRIAGLPTTASLDVGQLEDAWLHDKKYRRGVRFVLLKGLAQPVPDVEAPPEAVKRAVARLGG